MTVREGVSEYALGGVPTTEQILRSGDLASEWHVTMLAWSVPWWCRWLAWAVSWVMSSCLGWRKRFRRCHVLNLIDHTRHQELTGVNVSGLQWGRFRTERLQNKCQVFWYTNWSIKDLVRTTSDPDRLIGQFYFAGKRRGWFELRRIEGKCEMSSKWGKGRGLPKYDEFRTGLTYGDVYDMLKTSSKHVSKRRRSVLGFWHELKLQLYEQAVDRGYGEDESS